MQCDKANPLGTQWTIHDIIYSSLGFCGFHSRSQRYSMTSMIPCPLSPCSLAFLSQSPWHAFFSSACVQTLNAGLPQGPHPTNPLCTYLIKSLLRSINHVMVIHKCLFSIPNLSAGKEIYVFNDFTDISSWISKIISSFTYPFQSYFHFSSHSPSPEKTRLLLYLLFSVNSTIIYPLNKNLESIKDGLPHA